MKTLGRFTLLTATLFLSLAAAQTTTPAPATPAAPAEAAPAQAPATSGDGTSLTLPSGELALPTLEGTEVASTFTTVLGVGVVYRGSVTDAADRYAQVLTAAGFVAADAPGSDTAGTTDTGAAATTEAAGTDAAAGATTDTAAGTAGTTDTTTTGTGTTTTDTSAAATGTTDAAATTGTAGAQGSDGLPGGESRTFTRGSDRLQLRVYERGGLTVVLISRLSAAAPAGSGS